MSTSDNSEDQGARLGFYCALSAYCLWGLLPFYFRALEHIPPLELVAHRILWSVPIAMIAIAYSGGLGEVKTLFRDKKIVVMMVITASLITLNWGIYVWAISVNITSETALGYYINPLISVLLGFALLGEKLTRLQILAVAIAATAVLIRAVLGGEFPWIGLSLAFSFATYGYLRKTVAVGPRQGFLMEVLILLPLGLAYFAYLSFQGENHFTLQNGDAFWLMLAGPVTAVPLIFYAFGAKLLPLKTLGLMQYIAPSIIFLISFLVFDEDMGFWQGITFVMIWIALALYTWSMFRTTKQAVPEQS